MFLYIYFRAAISL